MNRKTTGRFGDFKAQPGDSFAVSSAIPIKQGGYDKIQTMAVLVVLSRPDQYGVAFACRVEEAGEERCAITTLTPSEAVVLMPPGTHDLKALRVKLGLLEPEVGLEEEGVK